MKTRAIAIICAALAMSGCATVSYKTTGFDVLRPADYTLPAWADTVLMVNNVVSPVCNDSTVPVGDAGFERNIDTYMRSVSTAMFREMAANFNESGYMHLRYMPQPQRLTTQLIDSLLKGHPRTVLLSLDYLECNSALRVSGGVMNEGDEIWGCLDIVSRTTSHLSLIASPYSRIGLNERTDTLIFSSCGPTTADVVKGFPILLTRYREQGRETGHQYAASLLPTWVRMYRSLYVTNSQDMRAAAAWVDKDDWEEAKRLWISIYEGRSKTAEKARAAINMATALEREDEPVEASMWASKALDIIDKADAKTAKTLDLEKARAERMFEYLLARAKEKQTLDKQMN